jgi:L-ascorbate metabolism protein UlaG (beta-lactamase superfamily)
VTTLALAVLMAACTKSTMPPAPEPMAEPTPEMSEMAEPMGMAEPSLQSGVVLATSVGDVMVRPVYHGTVTIEHGDTMIWVDPWSKATLPATPDADIVLITDIHEDHLDKDAIARVATADTVTVAPKAVADRMLERPVQHVLANGENVTIGDVTITAVPMYNNVRGPEPGKLFHDKGRGNGYLVAIGGKTIYLAGDTECVDEIKALTNVDLAFVPMNLPYTMPPEEAAECVKAFKPAQVVPYHYSGSDPKVFEGALAGVEGVQVILIDAYPGGVAV